MKFKQSQPYKFFSEVLAVGMSPTRIKALSRIPLYTNALFLISANVSNAVLGFVFWIIVARFYSAEQVGLASAAIASMGLVVSFSRMGLETALVRFLQQTHGNTLTTINTILTLGLMISAMTAAVFILGLNLWSPSLIFMQKNPLYPACFVIFCSSATLSVFIDYICIGCRLAHFALVRNLIICVLKIPLVVLFAVIVSSFGIVASWGISLVVGIIISMIFFLPRAYPGYRFFFSINRQFLKDMIRFAFANYISILLWSAPGIVFPIIVLNILGAESNAYFYVAWAIGSVIAMIPMSVSTSLFAEGSFDEAQLKNYISRSLKMVGLLLVPAVALALFLADKLLLLFGSAYSENATSLLRILALGTLPSSVNSIYIGIKQVQKDLRALVVMPAFVALLSLGISIILMPRLGIIGAGLGWAVGQSLAAVGIIRISTSRTTER